MKIPVNLEKAEEKKKSDITEIRTFEDACEILGLDPELQPKLSALPKRYKKPLMAFYKLMVITEAINSGWIPDLKDLNQVKYLPLFIADESGMNFSRCKHSSTMNHLKLSSFLFCESQQKEEYLSTQFEDLFKDLLLIARSHQTEKEDLHKYGRSCFNIHGYRH